MDESHEEEEDEAPVASLVEGVKMAYTKAKPQRKVRVVVYRIVVIHIQNLTF